jgi:hypothetical protein
MKKQLLFKEVQKFNQWWLWLIIAGTAILPLLQFDYNKSFLAQINIEKVILSLIAVAVLVLFLTLRMTTCIYEDYISVSFFPFTNKTFFWKDLSYAQIIDYGFVGGWGIRLWTAYGTVYNVRGSKGIHIKTANKQYLIGTQREKELRLAVAHLLK